MFTVYHSNQLDILKTLMAALIEREPLADPFAKEVILVQSPGMAQWLQIQLAEHFGIAANIEFPLPATFIWNMFTRVLPGIPAESAFSKDAMTWKVMWLLPQYLPQTAFDPLRHYLRDDADGRKTYQLAARVADLFDQYLVYRPHWLESWQREQQVAGLASAQEWQAPLWRALVEYTRQLGQSEWHRANLYQRFINELNRETPPAGLPQRVFICGISALPPVYLQALQALGRHSDIHLMFTNPCRFYWGDIQAQLIGNPLLASWGKLGRDNLYLLTQLQDNAEIDAFVEPGTTTLLQRIQSDMLELRDRSLTDSTYSEEKQLLARDDRSISFHLCHSAQREVEVLHDYLLGLFAQDPELTARDVIVMVADIDRYTPFIQAVFGNAPPQRYLPFAISDRSLRQAHPVLQGFICLLTLPESRFMAESILTLLEIPALAARFSINETGLRILRQWVAESGICWGLDDDTLRDLQLPATGQHTWRFGLTRMLLGYAMESESGEWQGVLPYDGSSGLIAALAGQLAELLLQLARWRARLGEARTLAAWQPLCGELLESFFAADGESEAALALIEQQWQKVITYGLEANYPQAVPLVILRDELASRLDSQQVSQRFLAGPINFCTLMPMRSIPFKVVCLLGMNDGVYPRTLPPMGFDLMADNMQKGDRSRRDDDRYLFLEALLSAQQRLYISYIGRSIQDNRQRYPSVLVTELLEYIEQSHCLSRDDALDSDNNAAQVRENLLFCHQRVPFSPTNYLPGSEWQSYAAEWLPAASGQGHAPVPFSQPLPPLLLSQLQFTELCRFYRHPVRAFFQQRLNVSFRQEEEELPTEEPFVLGGLASYQLNLRLLDSLIAGEDGQREFQRQKAAGQLPQGAFGELFWQQQCERLAPLAEQVRQQRGPTETWEVALTLEGVTLSGWLERVQQDGLLRWRPAKLNSKDLLLLWLEHLVYCAQGGTGSSRMYGSDNSSYRFDPLPRQEAEQALIQNLAGYQQGLNEPLLLLHKTAWAWLQRSVDRKSGQLKRDEETQSKARLDLLQAWQGNQQMSGEGSDPYIQRLLRQLTPQIELQIIEEAQRYLLPLLERQQ